MAQVAEVFTNNPGKLVPIEQTISGFKEILEGKYDHLPEVAFYMVGNIDEVRLVFIELIQYKKGKLMSLSQILWAMKVSWSSCWQKLEPVPTRPGT